MSSFLSVRYWPLVWLVAVASGARAESEGEVRLGLDVFRELERRVALLGAPPEVAIAAAVEVDTSESSAPLVTARLTAEVVGESWVEVALLPAGVALESATVDGAPLPLVARGTALVWSVRGAGRRNLVLRYRAPAVMERGGRFALEVPLPQAASTTLSVRLSGGQHGVEVVPGTVTSIQAGEATTVTAVVPRAQSAQVRWGVVGSAEALVTAAAYTGRVEDSVVRWRAELTIESATNAQVLVPVARADVAVRAATLDKAEAVLEERAGRLLVRVAGRGRHVLSLTFEAPTRQSDGPNGTALWVPRAPLSSFTLSLDGDKEVGSSPAGGIERALVDGRTVARVVLPVSDEVVFHWSAALPESVERELRVNADVVHVVRADEGVLEVTAFAAFEVARGKAQSFAFTVPEAVVVNAVVGEGISDWRVGDVVDGRRMVSIYLDREVSGSWAARVDFEQLVDGQALVVPLLVPQEVRRQRGMVALVRGSELEVLPVSAAGLAQVGENQLPLAVREQVAQKVTHTYKYTEAGELRVTLSPFTRELARYDAAVDTLYSLGEGVMRAAATVEVTVKAGSFVELSLALPEGINILSATAPSLREHRVVEDAGKRNLALAFTREMEGSVKVELVWERVMAPGDGELDVPLVHVLGAVVEHGRLGIEALSAVEVRELAAPRMMRVDAQELPQKLVLRTTNPILLAYHYVHAEPPASLRLSVKRHKDVAVQVAAIDQARYRTLWTRDGIALTRASYLVRNRGQQFLRVALPEGAVVWSAELAGQAVKPASDEGGAVLVPLLNANEPFEVVLVYLVRGEALGFSGAVEASLLVPDLIETESTWEVYLPDDVEWGEVETNMSVVERPEVTVDAPANEVAAQDGQAGLVPLQIRVPERGRRLVLRKLLSNQGSERASFRVAYRTGGAGPGVALVLLGAFALGFLVLRLTGKGLTTSPLAAAAIGTVGLAAVLVGVVVWGASLVWLVAAAAIVVTLALWRMLAERRATS